MNGIHWLRSHGRKGDWDRLLSQNQGVTGSNLFLHVRCPCQPQTSTKPEAPGQPHSSVRSPIKKEATPRFSLQLFGFNSKQKLFSIRLGEMASVLASPCPLLLLFLGLWEVPVSTKPENLTHAQWFQLQHVQPSPLKCNRAMGRINYYKQHCKRLNTFLHDSFPNVATVCESPSMACKNGQENCHQSPGTISMTQCDLTSGKYPNCKYSNTALDRAFIVACDPPEAGDPPGYQLVPVHLERTI
ncbi:ribonuclease 8 [Monodelphis domestica]|uniref:ribonuclease 8 n=1 Tax=Monodelphis domestica TaxID=13616 RepID=UPI0024E2441F|nr:ribonuclease 8 [Monodelphis domestica]